MNFPSISTQTVNKMSDVAMETSFAAFAGYLCGHFFRVAAPLNAAIFYATLTLVSRSTKSFFEKNFANSSSNHSSRILGVTARYGLALGAAIAVTAVLKMSVALSLSLIVTTVATQLFLDAKEGRLFNNVTA